MSGFEIDPELLSDVDSVDYMSGLASFERKMLSCWVLRQFYFGSDEQIEPHDGDVGFVSWD